MTRTRRLPALRVLALAVCLPLLGGCATSPIGVKRMAPDAVQRAITANALTENKPSIDSTNVLFRRGLFEMFRKQPVTALAELHRIVLAEDDNDTWFALSELSFLYAERSHDRRYSIMAAVYAWSYLFGGTAPDPYDPRLRIACDLYNRGLTQGLEATQNKGMQIVGVTYDLPIGKIAITFDPRSLEWNGRQLRDFIPVAELQVNGLENRFRTPGIGAPLAASAAVDNPLDSSEFLAPRLKTPVTALVRIPNVRQQIAAGRINATLELHTDQNERTVRIGDRDVPLEKEPSAVLASMVAEAPVIRQEIEAFIGTVTQQADKGRLAALRPHVRGRIPVVFVHGTASSPARWAEMVNVLDNDPRINKRFEPWLFAYNSSSPIIYSSYLLRKALIDAVQQLDPNGEDPALRDMVVIGHSQGGLLTKMTSVHSGDLFWKNVANKPFDEVRLDDKTRTLLHDVLFVEPLPFVKRVIFVCTPHRGSFLARDWVRGLITKLVSLPATVTTVSASVLTLNPDLMNVQNMKRPNAVDNMAPSNAFVKTLSSIPVAPGVAANSIIAVQGDGTIESGDDGVVKYSSAHLDGVESEKVVRSTHSTQAVPDTIEEVRRILLKHAAESPAPGPAPTPHQGGKPAAGKSPPPPAPSAKATSKSS